MSSNISSSFDDPINHTQPIRANSGKRQPSPNESLIKTINVDSTNELNGFAQISDSTDPVLTPNFDKSVINPEFVSVNNSDDTSSPLPPPPSSQLSNTFYISPATTILICANGDFDRCEKENIATYYCDSCEPALVMCHECSDKIHNNPVCQHHNRIPIQNMLYKDFEAAYKKSIVSQIEKYADDLDGVKEVIDDTINNLKDPLDETIKNIETNFIQVNDSMRKREKTLVKKSHELYNKKIALLRRQKALIEIVVKNADKAIGFHDNFNNNGPYKPMSQLSKYNNSLTHTPGNAVAVASTPTSINSVMNNKYTQQENNTSIEDLLLILKGLQNKYINNQEPVESADIRVHFDSLNFLRMLNQYGTVHL